ncbi:MAG TPA: hypothetical protein DCO68_12375 [Methylophilaceae bacterium]|nr:hypothetical protein [Methylophilaceae bacterium]HAJ72862.1 hypothetical protein [Methylophilaceae bacterium]
MTNIHLTINIKKLFFVLVSVELFFVAIYLLHHFSLANVPLGIFDLDAEATIPSWFSSSQYLMTGFVCLAINQIRVSGHNFYPQPLFYLGFVGFVFLSCDEAAQVHERLSWKLVHFSNFIPSFKNGHGAWIFAYAAIFVLILFYLRDSLAILWKQRTKYLLVTVFGFFTVFVGAIVLESVSYQFLRTGSTADTYAIEVALEEFLEMFGSSLMLYGITNIYIQSKGTADSD